MWLVISIVITDVVMVDEPFAIESRVFYRYLLCMIPMIIFFSDKDFLRDRHLNTNIVNALIPYLINIVFIITVVIAPRTVGIDSGFGFMARECAITVFWFFSIPLTVIYNVKVWCISAIAVCLNSILYLKMLDYLFTLLRDVTPMYLFLTVGVATLSGIVSFIIFRELIKMNCDEQKQYI